MRATLFQPGQARLEGGGRQRLHVDVGTLKMRMGATQFLMKRLPKVAAEMALHVLAYNLTPVMNTSASSRSGGDPVLSCGLSRGFPLRMTSGSFRNVSRLRDRRKSQSARSKQVWTAPKRF
jgi:hypothetical protein